jgi:hypothetical protein
VFRSSIESVPASSADALEDNTSPQLTSNEELPNINDEATQKKEYK